MPPPSANKVYRINTGYYYDHGDIGVLPSNMYVTKTFLSDYQNINSGYPLICKLLRKPVVLKLLQTYYKLYLTLHSQLSDWCWGAPVISLDKMTSWLSWVLAGLWPMPVLYCHFLSHQRESETFPFIHPPRYYTVCVESKWPQYSH